MRLYPNITVIFFIWVFSLFLITNFGIISFPSSGKFPSNNLVDSLANWDGGHFIGIAENGYSEKFQYAFFPVYPILINFVNNFVDNFKISAVLINFFCIFLGLQALFNLIAKDFPKKLSEKTILLLLFFPTSFFFLTAYSESLFILLTVLCFLFLRENKLLWATIFALIASGTRITGLAVVFAFLLQIQITQGINRKNWFVLLSPLGFIIYCWYLYIQVEDPFYFITAEQHWQRQITISGSAFWEAINLVLKGSFEAPNNMVLFDLSAAVFGLGLAIRSFRFLPAVYSVYALISVLIPIFTSTLTSMPRFLLPIFPIFLTLALIEKKEVKILYQVITLLFLGILSLQFVRGYWVA